MIYSAVTYIVSQLNQALKLKYLLNDEIVVISDLSAATSLITDHRLVAMLVNIERETFSANNSTNPHIA